MDNLVNISINGTKIQVKKSTSILEAAKKAHINIPTLCNHEDLFPQGNCGICVVQVKGRDTLVRSCITPVEDGMEIITHSDRINETRRAILSLIISNHPDDCLHCIKNGNCDLHKLADQLDVNEVIYEKIFEPKGIDDSYYIIRDSNKCILCRRCLEACQLIQDVYALDAIGRGFYTTISVASGKMVESVCVVCGQCISVCPVGALYEKQDKDKVWEELSNPDKIVIVQEAPAVRVSLAEEFNLPAGINMTGKMYSALKKLGFDYVFDTNFSADLTIMEEGNELLDRLKNNKILPVITSCSPGWIKFMETFFPDLIENVSTAKSPQQMFGALSKTYFAKEYNIDPSKIVTVSIMPCTAKKFECDRPEMYSSGYKDVDYVLTTREFVKMIKEAGIDFVNLPDDHPDDLMGQYTGAGVIFGTTGGVAEAALRTVYEIATGKELEDVDIKVCRGFEGIKEFEIDLDGTKVRCGIAHGLANARKLLTIVSEAKKRGEMPYQFVEIMACPGGCVGGGGQPFGSTLKRRLERAEGLYNVDKNMKLRKSHENPMIKKVYDDFLKHPLSEISHKLLHTHYNKRNQYI